ncbi:MAG: UDP-3-O-(3-hydroxymyristoyl)glucosamine N-acyltransferase [Chromatiales bacterium]
MTGCRLGDLAEAVGARLEGDPEILIQGVGSLEHAKPGEISFLGNARYQRFLGETQASAVILAPNHAGPCKAALLFCENPYLAYARAAGRIFPEPASPVGCHASAVVAASAQLDPTSWVGPCAVVGERVKLGAHAVIGPGCVVEDDCRIGEHCRLVAQVTLCHGTRLGRRCLIHPGAVLGSDGFGLATDNGRWIKVPQLGRVLIGDDVEIGANTTVDRGALEDTVLDDGVKLDNLVHIAHNVEVGEHTAMAATAAVAGSTKIGRHCLIGGMTGMAGHLTIGDNVQFTGATQVTRSFKEAGIYSGNLPAMDNGEWRKAIARIRHLDEMAKRLKALERQVAAMQTEQGT